MIPKSNSRKWEVVTRIWNLCGNEPFLASYIYEKIPGVDDGTIRSLGYNELIVQHGSISYGRHKLWKIKPGLARNLKQKFGLPDESVLNQCRQYITQKMDANKIKARERYHNVRNEKSRLEVVV